MRLKTSLLFNRLSVLFLAAILPGIAAAAAGDGDAARGAKVFRTCAACHSLRPDHNMTGPSLAGIWGRKAGSLASFERYSPALKSSGVVWEAKSLDAWLKNPADFIPHNRMTFVGINVESARADLLAFLKAASVPGSAAQQTEVGSETEHPDLKRLEASRRVTAIRYCRDTYHVTTADGATRDFWEPNLRFKTDSTALGPAEGTAAILPAGGMGDRASVFFARPGDISEMIKREC